MEVTERAKRHLHEALSRVRSPGSESCYRMVKEGDAFRMEIDVPLESDRSFTAEGDTVLVVGLETIEACEGLTLDIDASEGTVELLFLATPPGA